MCKTKYVKDFAKTLQTMTMDAENEGLFQDKEIFKIRLFFLHYYTKCFFFFFFSHYFGFGCMECLPVLENLQKIDILS